MKIPFKSTFNVSGGGKKAAYPSLSVVFTSDQQLLWLLSDLFIVGLDTTVTTLRWCFLFLLRHPHLQDALFHEIEANIGTERLPT